MPLHNRLDRVRRDAGGDDGGHDDFATTCVGVVGFGIACDVEARSR
jgi:hypothetical protein